MKAGRKSLIRQEWFGLVAVMFAVSSPSASAGDTWYVRYLRQLTDLSALPVVSTDSELATCSGGTGPADATGEAVLLDMPGPLCITRIRSASPEGVLRVFVDSARQPVVSLPFARVFDGTPEPFLAPLVQRVGKSGVSYLPIPCAEHCRITLSPPPAHPWSITVQRFPQGTAIESFAAPLPKASQAALRAACRRLAEQRFVPQGTRLAHVERLAELPPGRALKLKLRGPATIRDFRLRVTSNERDAYRAVTLAIRWDGERKPSVWGPVGPLFGSGFGNANYFSLPMGIDAGASFWLFPMPFARSAHIVVRNEAKTPALVALRISYEPQDSVLPEQGYFHAWWRQERQVPAHDYVVLDCEGAGRFLGMALAVDNVAGDNAAMGAVMARLDDAAQPLVLGSDEPDYFDTAPGSRAVAMPLSGKSLEIGPYRSVYRWHLIEPIRFTRRCRIAVANPSAGKSVRDDLSSTAYWYQQRPQKDAFHAVALEARLPRPISYNPGLLQAENLTVRPLDKHGRVTRVNDRNLPFDLDAGQGLQLRGKPGAAFAITMPASTTGEHSFSFGMAGRSLAPAYRFLQDNQPISGSVWLDATQRDVVLVFDEQQPQGSRTCEVVLDTLALQPLRVFLTQWMVIGPWENPQRQGLATPYAPEQAIVLDATYTGKNGKILTWKEAKAGEDGVVNLQEYLGNDENIVAYASSVVVAKATVETQLHVGSDDGIRVWLNGTLLHEATGNRSVALDDETIPVTFLPGPNALLLKIEQGQRAFGFVARVSDPGKQLSFLPRSKDK